MCNAMNYLKGQTSDHHINKTSDYLLFTILNRITDTNPLSYFNISVYNMYYYMVRIYYTNIKHISAKYLKYLYSSPTDCI